MINAGLQSMFNDSKFVNEPTITVNVDVAPSRLMRVLSKKLLQELHRVSANTHSPDVDALSDEDIYKYLCTLTAMRVWHVNDIMDKTTAQYKALKRNVAVPVLVYQLVSEIGICYDKEYSLRFKPVYSIEGDDLLEPAAMLAISDIMFRFETNGMKVVPGLPKDRDGELEFMALQHAQEVVRGYKTAHPVYGFLASFFEMKNLEEVTGMMCRIIYGCDSDYETYITRVIASLNS